MLRLRNKFLISVKITPTMVDFERKRVFPRVIFLDRWKYISSMGWMCCHDWRE